MGWQVPGIYLTCDQWGGRCWEYTSRVTNGVAGAGNIPHVCSPKPKPPTASTSKRSAAVLTTTILDRQYSGGKDEEKQPPPKRLRVLLSDAFGEHSAPFGEHLLAPFSDHSAPSFREHLTPFGEHLAPFGEHLAPACDDCAADEANHLQYTSKELFEKE